MSLKNKIAAFAISGMLAIATPFVAVHEGLSTVPYKDVAGVWTWCYGETEGQVPRHTLTIQECSAMLRAKLYTTGMAVWLLMDVPMSNSRWAALTSFSYNVGINAFRNSTLRRKLNQSDPNACDELTRKEYKNDICRGYGCGWAGGKMFKGLQVRREKEKTLCNS